MSNRFARVKLALGNDNFLRLKNLRIAIIGMGAVGGFAAEGLVRSGIGFLRLIDIDVLQISNMNRQITALDSNLGQSKVEVARQRFLQINPELLIDIRQEFFHKETADTLLDGRLDFVIDATDAAGPKIELLSCCHAKSIRVIASMGAAFKRHPELIRITDIGETSICPLARVVRRGLSRRGIHNGIPVVYSPEPGPPFMNPNEIPDPLLDTITHRGRPRRILGSLCTIPAIFGMLAAHYVIFECIDLSRLPQHTPDDSINAS
ncbi:tRNA threonylcarbamoyladenosine dehydratase [bacterium]|nr:tRNA threonylcarbamoyladenosine dehydratase [candidate division CSSED10-310 bacterium]